MPVQMRGTLTVLLTAALAACSTQIPAPAPSAATASPLQRIAFGSCSHQDYEQPIWSAVRESSPELWVWLGDNVYADTDDMAEMRAEYARAKAVPGYQALLATTPVIGTWDDHDYGLNDGGREFARRAEAQQQLLDFLDVPADSPVRAREGVYSAHRYGPAGQRIKVLLLDTRYHRDPIGSNGTVLGEEQWAWLERELRESDAQLHVIGSSIQVIPEDHRFEKWANFPAERERLLRLIGESGAPGVILLSGDRHIAEISRLEHPAVGYPLYEVTSSGMTHTWSDTTRTEANRHRSGDMLIALNFGLLEVDWEAERVHLQVRDRHNAVRLEEVIPLAQLRPAAGR